jgi:hypothetical protein
MVHKGNLLLLHLHVSLSAESATKIALFLLPIDVDGLTLLYPAHGDDKT